MPEQARREQVATTAPGMRVKEGTLDSFVLKQAGGRLFPLHIEFRRLCTAFFLCFSGYCVGSGGGEGNLFVCLLAVVG